MQPQNDYYAVVSRLSNVRKHPNADRLQVAEAAGHTVIVGLDLQEGQLGLLFPAGGQISEEFATLHDLVKRRDEQGNPAGGMFESSRRVRAIRLRGIESEGYFHPAGEDSGLKVGQEVDRLGIMPLCQRYQTPAQRQAQANVAANLSTVAAHRFFKEHTSKKLKYDAHLIQPGARVIISAKLHGTSGRTFEGETPKPTWLQRFLKRWFKRPLPRLLLTGSRRIVKLNWGDQPYRAKASEPFRGVLQENWAAYYEIVGYYGPNQPIQKGGFDKGSKQAKQYGESFPYSYGQTDSFATYLYAVTRDGRQQDWETLWELSNETGVPVVPTLGVLAYDGDLPKLLTLVTELAQGPDKLDPKHPLEGVVLRVENPDGTIYFLKHHAFDFLLSEGKVRDDEAFVDPEEVG